MNMYSKLQRWSLAALVPCLLAGELAAQRSEAFCALRDPDREIRLLAPAYEKHVSLVRTISKDARSQILEEVPFAIHFDELGQHTLYVVLGEKREVLGYVHVRSESFSWGLVRIAWMMNTNLDITGYRFQRCRSRHRAELESEQTANQLIGKSPKALIAMLTPDGSALRPGAVDVSEGANELMRGAGAEVLDIYGASLAAGGSAHIAGKSQDCVHWCLPGVPDQWTLMSLLRVVGDSGEHQAPKGSISIL